MASNQESRYTTLGVGAISTLIGVTFGAAIFYVAGIASISDEINFPTTASGIIISLNNSKLVVVEEATCTATGGNVKYNTCSLAPGLSGTGVIHRFHYEVGNSPVSGITSDCGFVKTSAAATSSGNDIVNNWPTGTGKTLVRGTGSTILWNGADTLECTTSANPTTPFTARMRVWYSDMFGE